MNTTRGFIVWVGIANLILSQICSRRIILSSSIYHHIKLLQTANVIEYLEFISWESHGKWNIEWEVRREMQVSSDSIYANSSFPKQLRSIASYRILWWKHFVFFFQYNKHYFADLVVGCKLYYVWGVGFKLFGDILEEIEILELEVVRKQFLM